MRLMRYINLFGKISHVSTTDCFIYNNTIYFAVPKSLVYRAVGKHGENIKKLSELLRRKIRIISIKKIYDLDKEQRKADLIRDFVKEIVFPVEFNSYNFKEGVFSISGARESKAILIGRNRSREKELSEILQRTWGIKEFKVI